jgi:hypothetical protein
MLQEFGDNGGEIVNAKGMVEKLDFCLSLQIDFVPSAFLLRIYMVSKKALASDDHTAPQNFCVDLFTIN